MYLGRHFMVDWNTKLPVDSLLKIFTPSMPQAAASLLPHGANSMLSTRSRTLTGDPMAAPVAESHSRTAVSSLLDAIILPVGSKHAELTSQFASAPSGIPVLIAAAREDARADAVPVCTARSAVAHARRHVAVLRRAGGSILQRTPGHRRLSPSTPWL